MILTEVKDKVTLVTMARPERANALDAQHWSDLAAAVRAGTDRGARAMVITGEGRTFCAGGDLNETNYAALLAACDETLDAITSAPSPVIAYVNGPAIGAGMQLAITCDLRVAEPSARFAFPAAAISRPVQPTVIQRLAAVAGVGAARAFLLGGEQIDGERAHQIGLVDRLGELAVAVDWAHAISEYAPLVMEFLKQELLVADATAQQRYEEFLDRLLASKDYAEAALAHQEKRPPRFIGR